MPKQTFQEKLDYWFSVFKKMKPGQWFQIAKTGKSDPKLFTDVCKEFMNDGNYDFEFTKDYKYFRRMQPFPEPINTDKASVIPKRKWGSKSDV